ncbi:hypothetical protein FAZ69_15715 [Trinickia terrae]|uniref:Uncharacterized protein n=1 Tax=Trinickia terrae TaxID=2571161 RepID=A0A4U1I3D1_9BURK|nr:hypothetical protein [Trinickia terrae]TKC87734.1 hypothetical protein FAZ69_15715 [Trinickia terrae]
MKDNFNVKALLTRHSSNRTADRRCQWQALRSGSRSSSGTRTNERVAEIDSLLNNRLKPHRENMTRYLVPLGLE